MKVNTIEQQLMISEMFSCFFFTLQHYKSLVSELRLSSTLEIMAFVRAQVMWSSRHHLLNRLAAHRMMLTALDQYMSLSCKQAATQVQIDAVAAHC